MQDVHTETAQQAQNHKASPPSSSKPKPSPFNWTTARVWRSVIMNQAGESTSVPTKQAAKTEETEQQMGLVGHATVETQRIYASFWPTGPFNANLKTPVPATHATTPAEDIKAERKHPDVSETFYSLNVKKIEEELETFEKEMKTSEGFLTKQGGYSAKGSGKFNLYKGENCTGLTYRLLKAGGINDLSSKCKALDQKLVGIITPHEMFECVKDAKKTELALYPETRDFKPQRKI